MPEVTYQVKNIPFKKCFGYMSGNSGLTKKLIHANRSESCDCMVLSSSLQNETAMGFVPKNLILPNGSPLKLYEGQEGIVISRNGYAGEMSFLSAGRYTLTDHAYILFCLKDCPFAINYQWFVFAYQSEMKKFITVQKGNQTWSITKCMKELCIDIPDIVVQDELAQKYTRINSLKGRIEEQRKKIEKFQLEVVPGFQTAKVKITDLFYPQNGRGEYTRKWCLKHKGSIPLYSGNTQGVFENIDHADYEGEYLTWAKDGLAGYIMYHNEAFALTGHRGILLPTEKCKQVDLRYIKYILEPIFRRNIKGRLADGERNEYTTLNSSMIRNIAETIPIPVRTDGTYDIVAQREIAKKYETVDRIKKKLLEQLDELGQVVISFDEK